MKILAGILIISCTLFIAAPAKAVQFTFTPRIAASVEYTDNVDLVRDDKNKEDDLITNILAGFSAQALGKSNGLELSYDPSYAFYKESEDNDGLRHNASLRAWSQLAEHTRVNFRNSFFLTEDPIPRQEIDVLSEDIPLLPVDTTVRDDRQQYYRNAASLDLNHQFGERDSIGINYVYSILRNDDETIEDNDRHGSSANLNLWFTPHFGTQLAVSYTRGIFDPNDDFIGQSSDDFDDWNGSIRATWRISKQMDTYIQFAHTNRDFEENEEDYKVYDSSLGMDYTFAENETLSFRVGYFRQDKEISDDETGIIVDGNLGKTWQLKRGAINLSASSGYNQSDFGAESLGFEVFYQARGAASYAFTRRLSGDINGNYRRSEFRDQIPEREDDIVRGGLGLNWQALTWMQLRLEYSYRQVNSNEDNNDYEENRGFFGITLAPDQPYRGGY